MREALPLLNDMQSLAGSRLEAVFMPRLGSCSSFSVGQRLRIFNAPGGEVFFYLRRREVKKPHAVFLDVVLSVLIR